MPPPPQRPGRNALLAGIAVAAVAGLVVVLVLARPTSPTISGRFQAQQVEPQPSGAIPGLLDLRTSDPDSIKPAHAPGDLSYPQVPPVGGAHNPVWQNCAGTVYPGPVADEHAVHSLEHGAVWITYRPGLPPAQVERLAARVRNRDHLMLSPHPDQDAPISLQAWGVQLTVDTAEDERINTFVAAFRSASTAPEPDGTCSQGTTDTGTTP